jgi:nucleoside-diphosphate-sugar epimerase
LLVRAYNLWQQKYILIATAGFFRQPWSFTKQNDRQKKMKILVTGGAGFIGSHIVEQLHQRAEVRVLDNLRSGHRRNLAGLRCEFIAGSILDREAVRRAVQNVDYVFHLAAMVSVPESMQKPVECNETNTTGTLIVLEEAARAGVKKLAFSSSAAIYGNNPTVPKVETMLPEPVSPYAVTKLDGEFYAAMFAREHRLATVSLRYFNVFGPRQDPRSQYAAAVPAFIERALIQPGHGQLGLPERDNLLPVRLAQGRNLEDKPLIDLGSHHPGQHQRRQPAGQAEKK